MNGPIRRHRWSDFGGLDTGELYALLKLRCDVFVVEQRCPYPEIDGRDPEALHLLAWDASGRLAGCLRLFAPEATGSPARIGRVATSAEARGTGLGGWLMREGMAEARRRLGPVAIEVGAQVAAEQFYAKLGFRRVSTDYVEDGVLHCLMRHTTIPRSSIRHRATDPGSS